MSKGGRVVRNIALVLGGVIVAVLLAAVITVQTAWFRNYVRSAIISSIEKSVGGRAEVGNFDFDVRSLHATVDRFTIHGNEPADAAPFVSIDRVDLYLRLFTSFT